MDKTGLKPANENPWYVLMTLRGEQRENEFKAELHRENRMEWNTLLQHGFEAMANTASKQGLNLPGRDKWRDAYAGITSRWAEEYSRRNNGAAFPVGFDYRAWPCDLSNQLFSRPVYLHGFFLPKGIILDRSHLSAGLIANAAFLEGGYL